MRPIKARTKKKLTAATAVVLAAVTAAGAFLADRVDVSASAEMMPGIENVVNQKNQENPFRILEIVNNAEDAQIGYLAEGQEPYLSMYETEDGTKRTFASLEEALSILPSTEARKSFAESELAKKYSYYEGQPGSQADYPLLYREYQEKYFLSGTDAAEDWKEIALAEVRTDLVKGHYEENTAGAGDYTRLDQVYYPVRGDVEADTEKSALFRENIQSFFTSISEKAQAPYALLFEAVANEGIREGLDEAYDYENGGYGYYENVYDALTTENAQEIEAGNYTFPGENGFSGEESNGGSTGTGSSADTGARLQGGAVSGSTVYLDAATAGTQANPYIYVAEQIDVYPYYQYTVVGDLKYVLAQAAANAAADLAGEENTENGTDSTEGTMSAGETGSTESAASAETAGSTNSAASTAETTQQSTVAARSVSGNEAAEDGENSGGTTNGSNGANREENGNSVNNYDNITTQITEGSITLDADQYWYWTKDNNGNLVQNQLFLVTGRQAVDEGNVAEMPEGITYPYYYKVKSAQFCAKLSEGGNEAIPEDYIYYGWYYSACPSGQERYIALDITEEESRAQATYYALEAQFELTPGVGGYDFVPGDADSDEIQALVQVDHLYYQGGFENQNWLKKYVFHLSKDAESETVRLQFESFSFNVEVLTIGEGEGEEAIPDCSSYDLVYVNGSLSTQALEKLCTYLTGSTDANGAEVPCIFNQSRIERSKLLGDGTATGSGGVSALVDYLKQVENEEVEDVSVMEAVDFVRKQIYFFGGSVGTGGAGATASLTDGNFYTAIIDVEERAGYQEILKYIASENQYRNTIDAGNNSKIEPLDDTLSIARALEYIINYEYKRLITTKSQIKVLDIEPCDPYAMKDDSKVREWLGYNSAGRGTILDQCCEETEGEGTNGFAKLLVDGDESTYWHSQWKYNYKKHSGNHWFIYQVPSTVDAVDGVTYTPRTGTNTPNGEAYQLEVILYDRDTGAELGTEIVNFGTPGKVYSGKQTGEFSKRYENVGKMKVSFVLAYYSSGSQKDQANNVYASGAEFSYYCKDNLIITKTMTSSEYVGHIEDINSEYDIIYFGASYQYRDYTRNGDGTTRLYSHVGGVVGGSEDPNRTLRLRWNFRLLGMMNFDYWPNSSGTKYLYDPANENVQALNGPGLFSGSGNDITKQQVEELKSFVDSGYPVIIADALLMADDKTKVNTEIVDSTSYMYEFLDYAVSSGRGNVFAESNAGNGALGFYMNLAKPQIVFTKLPPEPTRINDTTYLYNGDMNTADQQVVKTGYLTEEEEGLEFQFSIRNDSEVVLANASYHCQLYLDLNFDGNFSDNEDQAKYIEIRDDNNTVLSPVDGKYQLELGKQYTLTRKIPSDYYKMISWKIQISNNNNNAVRTSEMGFTKRQTKNGERQDINVLQVMPTKPSGAPGGTDVTWNLSTESKIQSALKKVEDFNIKITSINTRTFEANYKANPNYLDDYQMLILGFADGFSTDNISNADGAVDGIADFIKAGKSVIFSHDNTSFVNYDSSDTSEWYVDANGNRTKYRHGRDGNDSWTFWQYGYSMNAYLRSYVGMDRYGITSTEKLSNGQTVSSVLKEGKELDSSSELFSEIQEKVGDMAYQYGDKSKTSFMTQGYSNGLLVAVQAINRETDTVSKVNEGVITQYPYHMSDQIQTAITHMQYYQLAMEEDSNQDGKNDIVVWYCLSGNGSGSGKTDYLNNPNDVRNNYYFYSKGNVIYTGVGHKSNFTEEECNLFVNAMVAAAQVAAVNPDVTFLESFDPAANTESLRYYVADQLTWNASEGNLLEESMDFNIKIRDYNMVATSMTDSAVSSDSLTLELYVEDEAGENMTIHGENVKVRKLSGLDEENAVSSVKAYGTGAVTAVNSAGIFELGGNGTYQFHVDGIESLLRSAEGGYKSSCRIFAKVSSKISLYGKDVASVEWSSIELRPRQLFDLN